MLITYLDIYATLQTFKFSSIQTSDLTYCHALLGSFSVTHKLSDVFFGVQSQEVAQVVVANGAGNITNGSGYGVAFENSTTGTPVLVESGYGDYGYGGDEAPTISEIQNAEDLHGKNALLRVYDTISSTYVFSLYGVITELENRLSGSTLTIEMIDTDAMEEDVPKQKILSVYPNADTTTLKAPDAIINVVFGVMRKVPLQLVQASSGQYDYGAFRKPASGTLVVNNVYRDGAIVTPSEYGSAFTESPSGYYVVRFTAQQLTFSGGPVSIQVDCTSTEFTNPADAIKFVLNDATYGLGRSVNAASFTTAATDYTTLSIAIGDGLRVQWRAQDLINFLLLHGAALSKNTNGELTLTVDKSSLHTAATTQLGGDDGYWNNVDAQSISDRSPRLEDRRRSLTLLGMFDPGFEGEGTYLIESVRTRSGKKGKEDQIRNPFLVDLNSLDRVGHHLWETMLAREVVREVPGPFTLATFVPRQTVLLYVPALVYNGDTHEIRGITYQQDGSDQQIAQSLSLSLTGYSASIYSYSAGITRAAPSAGTLADTTQTVPGSPTGSTVTINAASKDTTGKVTATLSVSATAPSSNVSHIVVQLFETSSQIPLAQLEIPVAPSAVAQGKFEVNPGQTYDVQFFTRNKANKSGYQDSIPVNVTNKTASSAPGTPNTPSTPTATQTTGKNVVVDWSDNSDTNLRSYTVQRSVNGGAYSDYKTGLRSSIFIDKGTSYGTTYAYKVVAINTSGQASAASAASNSVNVAKITGSSELGAGTVTGGGSGSIATGTVTGGSGGNIGTDEVDSVNVADNTVDTNRRTANSLDTFSGTVGAAVFSGSDLQSAQGSHTQFGHGLSKEPLVTIEVNAVGAQIGATKVVAAGTYTVTTINMEDSTWSVSGTAHIF